MLNTMMKTRSGRFYNESADVKFCVPSVLPPWAHWWYLDFEINSGVSSGDLTGTGTNPDIGTATTTGGNNAVPVARKVYMKGRLKFNHEAAEVRDLMVEMGNKYNVQKMTIDCSRTINTLSVRYLLAALVGNNGTKVNNIVLSMDFHVASLQYEWYLDYFLAEDSIDECVLFTHSNYVRWRHVTNQICSKRKIRVIREGPIGSKVYVSLHKKYRNGRVVSVSARVVPGNTSASQ